MISVRARFKATLGQAGTIIHVVGNQHYIIREPYVIRRSYVNRVFKLIFECTDVWLLV